MACLIYCWSIYYGQFCDWTELGAKFLYFFASICYFFKTISIYLSSYIVGRGFFMLSNVSSLFLEFNKVELYYC